MANLLRWFTPALVILGLVVSQPTKAHGQEITTLILLLRTNASLTKDDVETALAQALEATRKNFLLPAIIKGKPLVKHITAVEYGFYNNVINSVTDSTPLLVKNYGDLELRQLLAADPSWQLKLGGAEKEPSILRSLKVYFKGEPKELTLDPAKNAKDLSLTQSGTYTLKLPSDAIPLRYEAEFETLGGKKISFKEDWPKSDNYYLIRMSEFRDNPGVRKALEEILRDPTKTSVKFDEFSFGKDVVIAIGSAGASASDLSDDLLKDNLLYISFPPLKVGSPKRAWMLFPIKEADVEGEVKKFEEKGGRDVVKMIRDSKPVMANEKILIREDMVPVWIELTRGDGTIEGLKKGHFGRILTLVNENKDLVTAADYEKLLNSFKSPKHLLVYEFDDGETPPAAIRYKPNGSEAEAFVNAIGMNSWSVLLNKAITSKKP